MLLLGVFGFLLYFLYDVNSILWKKKIFQSNFLVGTICIVIGTLYEMISNRGVYTFNGISKTCLFLSVICFILLIYTLFFSLPFDDTYVKQNVHKVYDKGMYGICRHPGIYWFLLFYLFLGIGLLPSNILLYGCILSALNFLYAYFQDVYTFMHTFDDYKEYKERVSFFPFIKPK